MRYLTFCLAGLAAMGASAANVFTVTLPTGATNTLAEAFDNGYVTSSEAGTEVSLANIKVASDLRVTGAGRLEINCNLKSANYTGDVHVVKGAILRLTAQGALGDTVYGGTFVEDGATLETEATDTKNNNTLDFAGERLSFAGTGTEGQGALVARTPSCQERNGVWGGTYVTMTGDALMTTYAGYQDFPNNSSANEFDMNGHTLTYRGVSNAKGEMPRGCCLRPQVKNPGHIIVENCNISFNDMTKLNGSAANTLTLRAKSTLELYASAVAGKKPWTLIIDDASSYLQASANGGYWDGPICYNQGTKLNLVSQTVNARIATNNSTFAGSIYAANYLTFEYGSTVQGTCVDGATLTLAASNDFAKGICITSARQSASQTNPYITTIVAANGALGSSRVTNAVANVNMTFTAAVSNDTLPALKFDGYVPNMTIDTSAASGVTPCVSKISTNKVTWLDGIRFRNLALGKGEFAMRYNGVTNRTFYAGMQYGWDTSYDTWYQDGKKCANTVIYNDIPAVTNSVALDVSALRKIQTTTGGAGTFYTGYIWNGEATNVTWRFASYCATRANLNVNATKWNDHVIFQAGNELTFANVTLKPGANVFDYRVGSDRLKNSSYALTNTSNWTKNLGLAVCKTSATTTDVNDFEMLSDPGDGSVLRIAVPGTAYYDELARAWSNDVVTVDGITAAYGSTLDLGTLPWVVTNFTGCTRVVATAPLIRYDHPAPALDICASFSPNVADLKAGQYLETEVALTFGEGVTSAFTRAEARQFASVRRVVAATSAVGISGIPKVTGDGARQLRYVLSDDAKTLYLEYVPTGTLLLFR